MKNITKENNKEVLNEFIILIKKYFNSQNEIEETINKGILAKFINSFEKDSIYLINIIDKINTIEDLPKLIEGDSLLCMLI